MSGRLVKLTMAQGTDALLGKQPSDEVSATVSAFPQSAQNQQVAVYTSTPQLQIFKTNQITSEAIKQSMPSK